MLIKDLLQSIPVFQELMGMKINFSLGYPIQKITQEIDIITGQYDKKRGEYLDEFGILSEDGKQYTFEEGQRELFDKAMAVLEEEEIKLEFTPIPVDQFADIDIEPAKIRLIDWLLVE